MEDRALFCRDCDESIHVPGSLSGHHQRLLATGIRVALTSACSHKDAAGKAFTEPPNQTPHPLAQKAPTGKQASSEFTPSAWAVDEFLQLSDYESSDKVRSQTETLFGARSASTGRSHVPICWVSQKEVPDCFGELDWFADIGLFHDQAPEHATSAAEVPELPISPPSHAAAYRPAKTTPFKKQRVEVLDADDYFTVPDLG